MNKNVQKIQRQPYLRIPVHGAPRLRGWAVRYVSGIDDPEIKPGFWLSQWQESSTSAKFNFEPELLMCFPDESRAKAVSDGLRVNGEIETEVVRID